jgi:GT2 family glycosyltransferase
MSETVTPLLVSVVIVNYNCKAWMQRCLESLRGQTIFERIEVIVADNVSHDGSDLHAKELMKDWPHGVLVQTGANLGFGGGANRGAAVARGKFLFFLNPDVWLERDCLELLVQAAESRNLGVAAPAVMNYTDQSLQTRGASGFDIFSLSVDSKISDEMPRLFSASAFYFIRRKLFEKIGGWDDHFFMYGEEMDIAWRVWISGETIGSAPEAGMHHWGAAVDNPRDGDRVVKLRSSDTKRFCAYRNQLLTLLKSAQHFLLLMLVPAMALVLFEGFVGAILLRRWSFFTNTSCKALAACWQLRGHLLEQRRRIRGFRRRGDFFMIRFLSWRMNRWGEFRQIIKLGLPNVEKR